MKKTITSDGLDAYYGYDKISGGFYGYTIRRHPQGRWSTKGVGLTVGVSLEKLNAWAADNDISDIDEKWLARQQRMK